MIPAAKEGLQVLPQLIPAGLEVTLPLPAPALVTVSVWVEGGVGAKVALTVLAASMVTVQLPVPLQAPPQPVKVEPAAGVAVNETMLPAAKEALQVLPQLIPAGLEVTVPLPEPALVTVSVWVEGGV